MQPRTISRLCCNPRWNMDLTATISNNQLSHWTKKKLQSTSQTQTGTKKKSHVIVWCLIHCGFLNLSETITSEKYAQQINEMHWKLHLQQLALINRKDPILLHNASPHVTQPTLQKLNELDYEVLPHPPHSPNLSTTDYHFFKHIDNLLQGKCFYNQQETENAF